MNFCDLDNPDCDSSHPPCEEACALDYGEVLQRSADRINTYSAHYYEIYPPDASNLKDIVTYIHNLLNPPSCDRRRKRSETSSQR
jgi:hypothetical protein